jgi:hypothetical protein
VGWDSVDRMAMRMTLMMMMMRRTVLDKRGDDLRFGPFTRGVVRLVVSARHDPATNDVRIKDTARISQSA